MSSTARLRLAIDCATPHLALALVAADGTIVGSRTREVGRMHAALMTIELTELFALAGVPRSAVAEVRVGVGPGSYTGVRVAVAAAKGLGRAWDVTVGGVYSLLAQVGPELEPGDRGVLTVDARRGNVYAQPCARRAGGADGHAVAGVVASLGPPEKLAQDAVAERFAGWRLLESRPPDAAVLAATDDVIAVEPLYL